MIIANIELIRADNDPWYLKEKNLICYTFFVVGPKNVTRNDLRKMVGEKLYGKPIRDIESYAVEHQFNKKISIAVDM